MKVTLARLSDKRVSVRLDEKEVFILPRRNDCSLDNLEDAMNVVLQQAEPGEWE